MENDNLQIIKTLVDNLKITSDHEGVKKAMASKGDITKVEGYKTLAECLTKLSTLEYTAGTGSLGKPLLVAKNTHISLLKHKDAFQASFKSNGNEATKLIYSVMTTSLFQLVSLICANGVTYVKALNNTYSPLINKNEIDKLSGSIAVTNLEKFVGIANKFGFKEAINECVQLIQDDALQESLYDDTIGFISKAAKNISGSNVVDVIKKGVSSMPGLVKVSAALAVIVALLWAARSLAEWFYAERESYAKWLSVQAQFLEMNAIVVGQSRPEVRERQEKVAAKLRSLADMIKVDNADMEQRANKTINSNQMSINTSSSQLL
jgi:hypothetical protein